MLFPGPDDWAVEEENSLGQALGVFIFLREKFLSLYGNLKGFENGQGRKSEKVEGVL